MTRILLDTSAYSGYAIIVDALRRAGTPIPTNDIWIAASAMQYGSTLLTTDPHFHAISQIVSEVFEPRPTTS